MALETFIQAMDIKDFKRHILATLANNVAEAVQKADDCIKDGDTSTTSVSTMRKVPDVVSLR